MDNHCPESSLVSSGCRNMTYKVRMQRRGVRKLDLCNQSLYRTVDSSSAAVIGQLKQLSDMQKNSSLVSHVQKTTYWSKLSASNAQ